MQSSKTAKLSGSLVAPGKFFALIGVTMTIEASSEKVAVNIWQA
jgi:hypothetical protein